MEDKFCALSPNFIQKSQSTLSKVTNIFNSGEGCKMPPPFMHKRLMFVILDIRIKKIFKY